MRLEQNERLKSRAFLVVGLIAIIAGIAELVAGPSYVAGGKWGWFIAEVKSHLGFYGYISVQLLIGVVCIWKCASIQGSEE